MTIHRQVSLTFALLLACTLTSAQIRIDYQIPFPRALGEKPDTVSIFVIGDVMMHSRQLEYDHRTFLENIRPHMQKADFCIANMEFPLGGEPYAGYPAFSAPDHYAEYIADCGANVFLTANNHLFDRGAAGQKRTLKKYREMEKDGIMHTGNGGTPLFIHKNGIRIAIVNFTYGSNSYAGGVDEQLNLMKHEDVKAMMEEARAGEPDFIIAMPHWGEEYVLRHSRKQEEWANKLVEWGADAIVGSHPHVVQDSTHIAGVPVIYSLGNAISNMSAKNTRLELAVTLRFVIDHSSGSKTMLEPQLDFMWCTLPGMLIDGYSTIMIKEWAMRRDDWLTPSDFDNMIVTLDRVKAATGISD